MTSPDKRTAFVKRFARFGFLFFLIKGLLWLLIPALIAAFFGAD